eukprot:17264-Heterococcus_DN1.PRE.2
MARAFASSFLRTLRLIIFATRQLPRTARVIRLAAVAVRSMSSVGRGMSEADAVLLVHSVSIAMLGTSSLHRNADWKIG